MMKRVFCIASILLLELSCQPPRWNKELPSAAELGNPRGFRWARTLIHLHSPHSYDACKQASAVDCLNALRDSFCMNRIDFAFLTRNSTVS